MNNKKDKIFFWGILILFFFLLLLLNNLTFFTSDDYIYHYVYKEPFPTEHLEKISGWQSIIRSKIRHYTVWNGRFVAHSILQFFMQFNKAIFNIFNSLAFLAVAILILGITKSTNRLKNKNLLTLQILLLLWLFIPEFGKTVLWMSGSANYLWTSLIYLGFLLFNLQSYQTNLLTLTVSIILGFLSGATNENSGPTIIIIAILLLFWSLLNNKKISVWRITGILSSSLGFMLMMKSPGSLKRGAMDITPEILIQHFKMITQLTLSQFIYLYIMIISLIIYLVLTKKMKKTNIYYLTILLIGYFSSIYSLILSPEVPLRTLFISSMLLIIILAYLLNMCYQIIKLQLFGTFLILLVSGFIYFKAFSDIAINTREVNQQLNILKKSSPNDSVVLKRLTPSKSLYNPYNGTANLHPSKNAWFNVWMAKYFGVKSIVGD
ncbi:hypothetical protein BW732_06485 [Vagococcus penaei]|uniref:Glycosyltransferase RgtA/B/C/D-like domain-containing protein n=1 Tax=Vagococcus penaei TaxID=633807 RepID=A0A1Q2D646_9ENTE|nr:DUF6056 family protein [Vagococcus penaei]AQP53898.1 hypothetical protein BW732_06485 [Vagococcus penaei]